MRKKKSPEEKLLNIINEYDLSANSIRSDVNIEHFEFYFDEILYDFRILKNINELDVYAVYCDDKLLSDYKINQLVSKIKLISKHKY